MASALQVLNQVFKFDALAAKEEFRWEDLHAAMREVISVELSPDAEHLLLAMLRFDGRIRFEASSEIPHSMPPEDMLKSLAVQALAKWTGPRYVLAMRRLQAQAISPALASVIRTVIQRLSQPKKHTGELERVAESSSEGPGKIRIRPLLQKQGLTSWADNSVRRREPQAA